MHIHSYRRKRLRSLRKRADPPKDAPSSSPSSSPAAKQDDKTPPASTSSPSSPPSTASSSTTDSSSAPSKVKNDKLETTTTPSTSAAPSPTTDPEPLITETPAILTEVHDHHDAKELANLSAAQQSFLSMANEAGSKSWTSDAQVYGNWAAQMDSSMGVVRDALRVAATSTSETTTLSSDLPVSSSDDSSSRSYKSTRVIFQTSKPGQDHADKLSLSTGAITGISITGAIVLVILALAVLRPCSRRSGSDRRLRPLSSRTRQRVRAYDDIPEMTTVRKSDDSFAGNGRTPLLDSAAAVKSAPLASSPQSPPRTNRLRDVVQNIKRSVSNGPDSSPAPAESEYGEVVDAPSILKPQIAYVPPALRSGPKQGNNTSGVASPSSGQRSSRLPNPFSSEQSAYT